MLRPQRRTARALTGLTLGMISLIGLSPAARSAPTQQEPTSASGAEASAAFLAEERGISQAEAEGRIRRQDEALAAIDAAGIDERTDFGGLWIDSDDRVTVGVTAGSGRKAVGDVVASARVDAAVVPVGVSLAHLEDQADALAALIRKLPKEDRVEISLAIHTPTNRLVVNVSDHASKEVASIVDAARSALGDHVVVEAAVPPVSPQACMTGPYCGPPLRGGIQINTASSYCSGGFYARSTSDNKPYLITAGHCPAGEWTTFASAGSQHVIGDRHSSHVGMYGDFGIIDIDNPLGWLPKPWVAVLPSATTVLDEEYEINAEGSSVVGMSVCKTGATTDTTCGFVVAVGATVTYTTGPTVSNLARADYCSAPGDSGAPVYRLHNAYGIHVAASGNCTTYYSSIGAAEAVSNVEVVNPA